MAIGIVDFGIKQEVRLDLVDVSVGSSCSSMSGLPSAPSREEGLRPADLQAGYAAMAEGNAIHLHDIYATAKRAALEHVQGVKRISVDVGKMAMVNPEQVEFLFNIIIEDDALLRCAPRVPGHRVFTRCSCGYRNERFVCPR